MQPYYKVEKCDDGTLMISTGGDIICLSDPNHQPGDEADLINFQVMCAALNMAHWLTKNFR